MHKKLLLHVESQKDTLANKQTLTLCHIILHQIVACSTFKLDSFKRTAAAIFELLPDSISSLPFLPPLPAIYIPISQLGQKKIKFVPWLGGISQIRN